MATEFISNSWLMPEQNNESKLSNYSLDFDGSSQYIDLTQHDLGTVNTISFWLKRANTDAVSETILGEPSNAFDQFINVSWSTNLLYYKDPSNNKSIWNISSYNDTDWHHYAITRNGTATILYVDNVALSLDGSSGTLSANTKFRYLGVNYSSNSQYFEGKLTEISIFDYTLSASQVTELYGTGSAIGNPMSLATKPVAYYPLGDSAFNGEFLATNNATELYENYALDFDGSDDRIDLPYAAKLNSGADGYTISSWVKINSTSGNKTIYSTEYDEGVVLLIEGDDIKHYHRLTTGSWKSFTVSGAALSTATWYHIVITWDGSDEIKAYLNNTLIHTETGVASLQNPSSPSQYPKLGDYNSLWYMNGVLSNIAFFDSALTAAQVTTLYNSGKPFDLNTFAVTPSFWWRLGAKTSFYNSTTSEWTILDEIGTNNGTGSNLGPAQTALTDGVATTNNGISSGMSSGTNKSGDAPYSTSNAVSYNMSVTAESTSVPT